MMKILHVVGARPNFMKTAPVMAEMRLHPQHFQQVLVHTGQHYDANMSGQFFKALGMPEPDEFLNVGSGTQAEQTAKIMIAFEPVLLKHKPDWVFVVGDVNSTVACTLVCAKLGVPVAHVEAGLRSRDRTMPEEINRLLTDQMADLLFTPSKDGDANLLREGIAPEKIHFVGNVMIDSLTRMLPAAEKLSIVNDLGLKPQEYVLATFHRPANVDDPAKLRELLSALETISRDCVVLFPVHPRTKQRIESQNFSAPGVRLLEPQGYLEFLALMKSATALVTDSGGVQEETTFLGVPCLTVRTTTERPVTITEGTNQLVASDRESIVKAFQETLKNPTKNKKRPEFWDGKTAGRIVDVMHSASRVNHR